MLRSNSKKARENVQDYIVSNFDATGYCVEVNIKDFSEVATFILDTFHDEKVKYDKRKMSQFELFEEWAAGLPSVLDTCYYYNRSAVSDLGDLLEETEEEKERYNEEQAEKRLTYLIYNELVRNYKK
jgi:hypothetical protein